MSLTLLACDGGSVTLPDRRLVLASCEHGGNLVVLPPRPVWERGELTATELAAWSMLVAASGWAMLAALPQLEGGCINYWEAGNWAVNEAAEPRGPKRAADFRRVHLHLIGRSPGSTHPSFAWGEAPVFPRFTERHAWATAFERLGPEECRRIVERIRVRLEAHYGVAADRITAGSRCEGCGYPTPSQPGSAPTRCEECQPSL